MRILLLGSNPSGASTTTGAFDLSTKSGRTLSNWMARSGCHWCELRNVVSVPTPKNRPLKLSEVKEALPGLRLLIACGKYDRIVAIGKTAAKALTLLHYEFFELPHPSGRNRLLNDPAYIDEKLKRLAEFINKPSSI